MQYRYFVGGVERKPEDMTKEEKRARTEKLMAGFGAKRIENKKSDDDKTVTA